MGSKQETLQLEKSFLFLILTENKPKNYVRLFMVII